MERLKHCIDKEIEEIGMDGLCASNLEIAYKLLKMKKYIEEIEKLEYEEHMNMEHMAMNKK